MKRLRRLLALTFLATCLLASGAEREKAQDSGTPPSASQVAAFRAARALPADTPDRAVQRAEALSLAAYSSKSRTAAFQELIQAVAARDGMAAALALPTPRDAAVRAAVHKEGKAFYAALGAKNWAAYEAAVRAMIAAKHSVRVSYKRLICFRTDRELLVAADALAAVMACSFAGEGWRDAEYFWQRIDEKTLPQATILAAIDHILLSAEETPDSLYFLSQLKDRRDELSAPATP